MHMIAQTALLTSIPRRFQNFLRLRPLGYCKQGSRGRVAEVPVANSAREPQRLQQQRAPRKMAKHQDFTVGG